MHKREFLRTLGSASLGAIFAPLAPLGPRMLARYVEMPNEQLAQQEGWEGLFQTIWMGALVVAVMLVAGRLALPRLFGQAARTKSPELFLAASLLVVIGASLATSLVGLSPIVGALVAGLVGISFAGRRR